MPLKGEAELRSYPLEQLKKERETWMQILGQGNYDKNPAMENNPSTLRLFTQLNDSQSIKAGTHNKKDIADYCFLLDRIIQEQEIG